MNNKMGSINYKKTQLTPMVRCVSSHLAAHRSTSWHANFTQLRAILHHPKPSLSHPRSPSLAQRLLPLASIGSRPIWVGNKKKKEKKKKTIEYPFIYSCRLHCERGWSPTHVGSSDLPSTQPASPIITE